MALHRYLSETRCRLADCSDDATGTHGFLLGTAVYLYITRCIQEECEKRTGCPGD